MSNRFNKSNKRLFDSLLKIIEKNLQANNIDLAIDNLKKALLIEPKNFAILNEIGNCYALLNDSSSALEYHNKAGLINEKDPTILANIGIDLFKLDRIQESIKFFNFALELDEKHYLSYSGLTSALHNSGDINGLYKISIKAITIFPDKFDFHLSLGIALVYLEKYQEALYCLETAAILNPSSIEVKLNTAAAYSRMGKSDLAIQIYEKLISILTKANHPKVELVKFNLSFEYLNYGDLAKGWDYYEHGFNEAIPFNQRRKPYRRFNAAKWAGQALEDETLLVWREQGLGDELLFLSLIPDLLKIVKNVIIECDSRLINVIKNTFPSVQVRESKISSVEDFQYEISMGSLCKFLRSRIEDFENSEFSFKIKNFEHSSFINFLKINSNKLLIGICWRSGLLNLPRNNNYIPLNEWGSIFNLPNVAFVNLQYGDCEDELLEAEEKFNVSIARWHDIDLKNDLDSVFGIIKSLDCVVTAGTAVASMACLSGIKTFVFKPNKDWASLGTDHYPWSKCMHEIIPKDNESINTTLDIISRTIIELAP